MFTETLEDWCKGQFGNVVFFKNNCLISYKDNQLNV